jgi:hypothetical protein
MALVVVNRQMQNIPTIAVDCDPNRWKTVCGCVYGFEKKRETWVGATLSSGNSTSDEAEVLRCVV